MKSLTLIFVLCACLLVSAAAKRFTAADLVRVVAAAPYASVESPAKLRYALASEANGNFFICSCTHTNRF